MTPLAVESIGILAPGLAGWATSRDVLAGERPYIAEPMPKAIAALLPANERRRTTATIKLALQVAQEAMDQAKSPPTPLFQRGEPESPQPPFFKGGWRSRGDFTAVPTVFASSGGDSEVLHNICTALIQPDRPVSPTHFHQSVHNTPAGYWSIATGRTESSLSLSAYDGSFIAGLLEAAALAWTETARVLLVAYDLPLPFPLSGKRHIVAPFAVALLLNPVVTEQRHATLHVRQTATETADRLDDLGLEQLRAGNPAARSLPLLCAIARREGRVALSECRIGLRVDVEP